MKLLKEFMADVAKQVAQDYPESCLTYFCSQPYFDNGVKSRIYTFAQKNTLVEEEKAASDTLNYGNDRAQTFVADVFLNWFANQDPDKITLAQAGNLYNAVLEYATAIGRDASEMPRYKGTYIVGQQFEYSELENNITLLESELAKLKAMRKPFNIIGLIRAQAKKLRKAGRLAEAQAKEAEAQAIEQKAKDDMAKRERDAQTRAKRIANLVHGREVLAAKRAEERQKREQAERDRERAKQFNPHRAAKAKMKAIKQRQEERKAGKKKGKEADVFAR